MRNHLLAGITILIGCTIMHARERSSESNETRFAANCMEQITLIVETIAGNCPLERPGRVSIAKYKPIGKSAQEIDYLLGTPDFMERETEDNIIYEGRIYKTAHLVVALKNGVCFNASPTCPAFH